MNRRLALALVAGLVNAVVVYGNGYLLLDLTMDAEGADLFLYRALQFLGMAAIGAGAAYVLLRYGLIVPASIAALFAAYSLYDHVSPSMEGFTALYLGIWFVALAIVALAAALEYGIRAGTGMFPPAPLG